MGAKNGRQEGAVGKENISLGILLLLGTYG